MLIRENTKEYLNSFAKYVIQQSRSNLTKGGKNSTKDLYNSLDKEIEVGANSFRLALKILIAIVFSSNLKYVL